MQVASIRLHRRSGAELIEHELQQCIDAADRIDPARGRDAGVDLVLRRGDGSMHAIEAKAELHGVRELRAAVAALALAVQGVEAAWLLIRHTKLTPPRLHQEWQAVLCVLRPEIAKKLAAVALTTSGPWFSDGRPPLAAFERWVDRCMRHDVVDLEPARVRSTAPTGKFFDVWKVLLAAWLRREGPLPVHEIAARAGAAYPTVAQALKRLEQRGELRRGSDRSAGLRRWPGKTYAELEPLLPALRQTMWFADQSGRSPDPAYLLRRLHKTRPANVAIGGVDAARRLDEEFDLLGTPRLDVTLHAPREGTPSVDFVRQVDSGLVQIDNEVGAVLAVHHLTRKQSLFEPRDGLPDADPAEVVLDLAELGLTQQMGELIQRLGGGV